MDAMKKVQNQTNQTVNKVQSQVGKVKNIMGTIGKVIGAALSVTALVNFGKACIDLGSDLAEVQNVVDVTFGEMNQKIETFAQGAAEQFGLSELAAKQYASTIGAMLKSMGITGTALEDMSIKMTGLAGDMASFYNLDTDVAFQKIRAGISGETEPLKQLGINLSVANLQQFALTQGITKSYNAMTQQEQALLRYNYLLQVTADAQGDFARTSDSWANQTRILQLRLESIKATIGQGLINVLTPVLKVINELIAKLQVAANAFKKFTELITGKKVSTATSGISSSLGTAAGNAGSLTGKTEKAGKAAKKAEEAYHGLLGFDEINALTKATDTSGTGDAGVADVGDIGGAVDGAAEETEQVLNPALQKLIDRLKELRDLFLEGFKAGLGDVTLEPLKNAIDSIRTSLKNIFTDSDVINAANKWLNTWAYAAGQVAGSITSIGITIATNLVGGIAKYLEQNTDRIKKHIVSMLDITSEFGVIYGNFAQAVANIFSVFGGENGQQVTANIIGIFTDTAMGVMEIMAKAGRDILDVFTRPFIDNQEGLKTALDGILEVFVTVTGAVKETMDSYEDTLNAVYDEHLKPFFDSLASGLSDTVGKAIECWNTNVKPVLDELGTQFSVVMREHISPMMNKVVELIGAVVDAVKALWEGMVKPFIDWCLAYISPVILPIIQTIVSTVMTMAGNIADIIGGIIDVIRGIIDFVVGIFTGDWEKAWNGVLEIITGVMNTIKGVIELVMNAIGSNIELALNAISAIFSTIYHAIASYTTTVFNAIKTVITTTMSTIKNGVSTGLNSIKTIWTNVWTSLKTTVITIFDGIWSANKNTINSIIGGIEHMANAVVNGINTVIGALNNLKFDIPDWIPELGGKTFGFNIATLSTVSMPRLAMGGIVDTATPLIAGEAGTEAIVPLERNTSWMDTIANKLGGMIVNSLEVFFNNLDTGGDGYQTVTTVVQLNGKTLIEQTDQIRHRMGYQMTRG